MTKILDEGKRILIVVGALIAAIGQVMTYVPVLPSTQKGLALATTVVGVAAAVTGALLQVIENVQTNQPVDVNALADALHSRLQAAAAAPTAQEPINPAPVPPAAPPAV